MLQMIAELSLSSSPKIANGKQSWSSDMLTVALGKPIEEWQLFFQQKM